MRGLSAERKLHGASPVSRDTWVCVKHSVCIGASHLECVLHRSPFSLFSEALYACVTALATPGDVQNIL